MEMYYISDFGEIVPHPFSVVVHASGFDAAYLLHADIVARAGTRRETAGVWKCAIRYVAEASVSVLSFRRPLQICALACSSHGRILDYANGLS